MHRFAAIQMASGPNVHANLNEAARLVEQAVDSGAVLVVLPENFAHMGVGEADKLDVKEKPGHGVMQEFLSVTSAKHGIWLVGGSIPMQAEHPDKVRAACLIYNDKGHQVARYDKIHLFDVHVEESGENYTESLTIEAGDKTVVVDTPFGKLGVAVCYDLRFPEIFRELLAQGMEICAVPSAFTAITGRAHWEILVRARAIENLSYVIASAQGGYHVNGRETYGDSMIVGPWGKVLDRLASGSGYVIADFDPDRLHATRRNFPSIEHARLSCNFAQLGGTADI